jgi:hypothetical protein
MSGWRKKQIAIKEELVMELDFLENDDGMQLNYGNIAMAEWLCPTIRLTALDLQKQPYITLGDWFQKQSDNSIRELQHLAEHAYEDPDSPDNEDIEQMMILTMMLAAAEGTDDLSDTDNLRRQLSKLIMTITLVSLARKGLVRVFYENLTLGADMDDAKIAEKI